MHKIKEMLMKELQEYEKKGNISMNSLDVIHKMTDTIKNIDKIEMIEYGDGYSNHMEYDGTDYSRGGEWNAHGSYDNGSSYAHKGQHYVRGHYSRDGEDYSNRRDTTMGRYSRDESRDYMMKKFDEMLAEAKTPAERETLKKCIDTIGSV